VIYLDKVFALTFLDIDQGENARTTRPDQIGGETLEVCTGKNSWGYPERGGKSYTQLKVDANLMPEGDVCHKVQSTTKGDVDDNVWNPAVKENGKYVGLKESDMEKAFVAATWQSNITFDYTVREGGVNEGYEGRNLVFAAHATSFCRADKAAKVKEDHEKR
jgi:hypothetical protein